MTLTHEQIDAIEAGCVALPDELWAMRRHVKSPATRISVVAPGYGTVATMAISTLSHRRQEGLSIAHHFARLDPATVRELCRLARIGLSAQGAPVGWKLVPVEPTKERPTGAVSIEHDGFSGDIIGHYITREGKRGVVVQQHGTRVVHVYGEKWLKTASISESPEPYLAASPTEAGFSDDQHAGEAGLTTDGATP